MGFKEKIVGLVPWIEPVIDYFDWRKRLIALTAGIVLAVWSFVKDLPWPVIAVLTGATIVIVAYALVFPAFVKLIHVGVNPRPDYSIWKHRKAFALFEAAYLLADREPIRSPEAMVGSPAAWFGLLCEAISHKEIAYVPTIYDPQHTLKDGYHPHLDTPIAAAELKKFCEARSRYPEFLR
jgi:hypothetical protein